MICAQYNEDSIEEIVDILEITQCSPILMSPGNHGTLVKELAMHPLLFSKAKIWLVPTHCAHVPLRLDSRVYFYDGSESDNIAVYERLIKNGRLARRTLFNWPQEKKHYLRAFEKQSIIRSSVIWPCPFLMQLQM